MSTRPAFSLAVLCEMLEQRINVKRDQSFTKLIRQRFGNSLVVTHALRKEIFAHQLNERNGYGGESHHRDQQVGK